MNGSPPTDFQVRSALRVDLAVEHPECWIIELSSEAGVDVLGRGVYRTDDRGGARGRVFHLLSFRHRTDR